MLLETSEYDGSLLRVDAGVDAKDSAGKGFTFTKEKEINNIK